MGKALQTILIVAEVLITLLILIPIFLWLLLNIFFTNYKISKNRKKMIKMLRKEGLPEHASTQIAEHIFPKIEFSSWKFLIGRGEYIERKRGKIIGKQDRRAYQEDQSP